LFVFVLHRVGQTKAVSYLLAAMLGAELYLTFVQVCFIHAFCFICFCFLVLLSITLAFAVDRQTLKTTGMTACLLFFVSHFVLFFPNVELKPTLMQPAYAKAKIEVFGSPSCPHCREAMNELKQICSAYNAELIIRPVSLSPRDRNQTLEWICNVLFEEKTGTAKRLAEKIVWKNENTIKQLEGGDRISVPLILVRTPSSDNVVLRGWSEHAKELIYSLLADNSVMNTIVNGFGKLCTNNSCSGGN